ncbi:UxaA family hydrolase [Halomicrobium salinisoli]|uniref:UxaA family hydrolase n=1 Tax=Halomicrobium salinisoli TaxID=2878391 RepID=UPI001CF00CFC|nr:UxaA family hydrolase [Halomicrobium salinisoli]
MKGAVIDDVALVMTDDDTVATALADLEAGRDLPVDGVDGCEPDSVTLCEDVPFGHKVALTAMAPGDPVYKYGEVIGEAAAAIDPGEWVHTHNCESRRGRGDVQEGEA